MYNIKNVREWKFFAVAFTVKTPKTGIFFFFSNKAVFSSNNTCVLATFYIWQWLHFCVRNGSIFPDKVINSRTDTLTFLKFCKKITDIYSQNRKISSKHRRFQAPWCLYCLFSEGKTPRVFSHVSGLLWFYKNRD